jgi:hypothetical protein
MLGTIRRAQRRSSGTVTGLLMTSLWCTIAYYTPFAGLKVALLAVAGWKLVDTLNNIHRGDPPHVGGGLTSSAATHDQHHELTPVG